MLKYILFILIPFNIFAGNIYECKTLWESDIKVYITNKSYEADLIVYRTAYEYEARNKDYIWYKVSEPYYSDVKIYYVNHKYEADLKVFFVDEYRKSWVGWQTNKKDIFSRFPLKTKSRRFP